MECLDLASFEVNMLLLMVLHWSMKRMKPEAALPPLVVTTPESSSLKTPIRDRLRIPILVLKPSDFLSFPFVF